MGIKEFELDNDIQGYIDKLALKLNNKSVLAYGGGGCFKYIFENYDLSKINIKAIADRKFKNNEELYGIKAISPDEIKNLEFDKIIITNFDYVYFYDVVRELLKDTKYKDIEILPVIDVFSKHEKTIFTFWEPYDKMPDYLKLCQKTWEKFLPDYKIVNLNYSNLANWLDSKTYDKILYRDLPYAMQADAVRCAILLRYGGIWLDCDTIITSGKIRKILKQNSQFTTINGAISIIIAKKNAKILKHWMKLIKKRIFLYHFYKKYPKIFKLIYGYKEIIAQKRIVYLGKPIDEYNKKLKEKYYKVLNGYELFAYPEKNFYNNSYDTNQMYLDFYFKDDKSDYVFQNENGVILLHNSWTYDEYKNMKKEEFLKKNKTLSNIFKKILTFD